MIEYFTALVLSYEVQGTEIETLVWFQSLLLSIVVSAVVFRPVTILLVTGLFPTLVIEAGLRGGGGEEGGEVVSSNEIEMIERGNSPNQHDLLF